MKNTLTLIALSLLSSTAFADGFLCSTEEGLNVKVFNHSSASEGTRKVAKMIVSNEFVQAGNKTIATFSDVKGTVASYKQTYVANVDLRFKESNRKGELVGDTKLGELDLIILSVDFSYDQPVEKGIQLSGWLTLVKRDGEEFAYEATCTRYLKN